MNAWNLVDTNTNVKSVEAGNNAQYDRPHESVGFVALFCNVRQVPLGVDYADYTQGPQRTLTGKQPKDGFVRIAAGQLDALDFGSLYFSSTSFANA